MYEEFKTDIVNKCGTFEEKESGWLSVSLLYLEVNINQYNPLRGGSYIKLPKKIEYKKAVLNIQNKDDFCFAYSVMAALAPTTKNPCRPSSYPHFSSLLKFNGIEFPVQLKDISSFEKQNNISTIVFGLEYEYKENTWTVVGPLYFASGRKQTHLNLLYITENDAGVQRHHYCLIKDMSSLISRQRSKHNGRIYTGCLAEG
nr:unnamed protein product [Callosobruchus analis]